MRIVVPEEGDDFAEVVARYAVSAPVRGYDFAKGRPAACHNHAEAFVEWGRL
jgi:hypothetical protein